MRHPPLWTPEPDETRFAYGNVDFVLAGMIVEAVTGRPWERVVRERIRAAGAMVSSVNDVHTFLRALVRGKLVGLSALASMRRTVPVDAWMRELYLRQERATTRLLDVALCR